MMRCRGAKPLFSVTFSVRPEMSKKNAKPKRPVPRVPRGLRDIDPVEIREVEAMLAKIKAVYERYGFEPVETPFIEYTEALGKFLPDEDRPNQGVFSFQDDDEQWLSLRYDLTAPLARFVAENYNDLPRPYRSYRAGYVFRNEKPGPGRYRQFMQMDADTVGAAGPVADAEMCMMMADVMEALGLKPGEYVIRVNNRKVLDGVMEAIGVTDEAQKLTVLRAIDKFDKFGIEGVQSLLGEGRKDESGDYTKGAGLTVDQANRLLEAVPLTQVRFRGVGENSAPISLLQSEFMRDNSFKSGALELNEIGQICLDCGYDEERVFIDGSVVRGLEYYTGPVFEAELTFEIEDKKGRPMRFGSVGGGGRYDGLVGRFRAENVPATGFSIGVSRLYAALKAKGLAGAKTAAMGPVVVCVMDKDRMADYQKMAAELRAADIPLREVKGCFISNELVDAFPVHRFRMQDGEPQEVFVALDDGAFVEILDTPSTPLIAAHIEALGFLPTDGSCGELNAAAADWLAKVSDALVAGFVITIDYGDTATALNSRRPRGSVQTYYRHTEGSSPYQRIGRQDISAHVDFSLLQRAGADAGLQTVAYATHAELLRQLGFDELMEQMSFMALSRRERHANIEAMRGLVNPNGLGRFKALVQQKTGAGWRGVSDRVEIAPDAALRDALPLPLLSERYMRLTDGLYSHTAFEAPSLWGDAPGSAASS